jgi:hypothetical protein
MLSDAPADLRHPAAAARDAAPAAGPQARSRPLLLLALAAAVAVLWMATRPYQGVIHDARLYTLQAISAADPGRFAEDLFLRFGSQDRFTAFSHLYAPVLRWAGVSLGAMLLTLAAQAAWLGAAFFLATAVLRDPVRALAAVAGLVALPSAYGAQFVFSYGERFLTPRLFAEALTLLALGCAARGLPGRAAAALAAAAAFHPVMALPGAAAFFFHQALGNRAWWAAAACAGAATVGLAVLGIEPFARLGVRLDPDWFEIVRHRSAYAFMGGWSALDHSLLAGQAALALLAALAVPGAALRRTAVAVLLAAAAGLGLTVVGADLAQNQLLTNIQPWRATWLLGVAAHLFALPILLELAGRGGLARDFAGILVAGGLAVLMSARLLPGAHVLSAALLTAAAVLVASRRGRGPLKPVQHTMALGVAVAMGMSLVQLGFGLKAGMDVWPEEYRARLWAFTLCVSGLGVVAAAVPRPGSPPGAGAPGPVLAAAVAFLLFCGVLGWDQRTAWTKFVESPEPPPGDLAELVPGAAAVYWEGGVELLWFRLNKPSYHSCAQGAGVMFFRQTATAYRHRSESFRFEAATSDPCGPGPGIDRTPPTRAELRRACVREPGLDRIVLPYNVPDVPGREWVAPAKLQIPGLSGGKLHVREFDRFYAYACETLR